MNDSFFKGFSAFSIFVRMIPIKVANRLSIFVDSGLNDFTILVSFEVYLAGIGVDWQSIVRATVNFDNDLSLNTV